MATETKKSKGEDAPLDILTALQSELKAPKGQYNSFGKYKYRSCEDILEALKPLLKKRNAALLLSDEVELMGNRYYVKATATLYHEGIQVASTTAFAREEEVKKGMDASQITGTASSYARKYALNGLFLIDDTKDADNSEHQQEEQQTVQAVQTTPQPRTPQLPAVDNPVTPETYEERLQEAIDSIKATTNRTELQTAYANIHPDIRHDQRLQIELRKHGEHIGAVKTAEEN